MSRFRAAEYQRNVEEYLHSITYRFLNLPPPGNRWFYPDVKLWDEDKYGRNIVPGFVIFYFNQSYRYPYEKRFALKQQLQNHIPESWDLYWFFGEGYIYAERKGEGIESVISPAVREMNYRGVSAYDETLSRLKPETNGHKDLEDADDLLMVQYTESDRGSLL